MCVKEFYGYACGHCSLPAIIPCPLTNVDPRFPPCFLPAERCIPTQNFCPGCARADWNREILQKENEHSAQHISGECSYEKCGIAFTQEERIRIASSDVRGLLERSMSETEKIRNIKQSLDMSASAPGVSQFHGMVIEYTGVGETSGPGPSQPVPLPPNGMRMFTQNTPPATGRTNAISTELVVHPLATDTMNTTPNQNPVPGAMRTFQYSTPVNMNTNPMGSGILSPPSTMGHVRGSSFGGQVFGGHISSPIGGNHTPSMRPYQQWQGGQMAPPLFPFQSMRPGGQTMQYGQPMMQVSQTMPGGQTMQSGQPMMQVSQTMPGGQRGGQQGGHWNGQWNGQKGGKRGKGRQRGGSGNNQFGTMMSGNGNHQGNNFDPSKASRGRGNRGGYGRGYYQGRHRRSNTNSQQHGVNCCNHIQTPSNNSQFGYHQYNNSPRQPYQKSNPSYHFRGPSQNNITFTCPDYNKPASRRISNSSGISPFPPQVEIPAHRFHAYTPHVSSYPVPENIIEARKLSATKLSQEAMIESQRVQARTRARTANFVLSQIAALRLNDVEENTVSHETNSVSPVIFTPTTTAVQSPVFGVAHNLTSGAIISEGSVVPDSVDPDSVLNLNSGVRREYSSGVGSAMMISEVHDDGLLNRQHDVDSDSFSIPLDHRIGSSHGFLIHRDEEVVRRQSVPSAYESVDRRNALIPQYNEVDGNGSMIPEDVEVDGVQFTLSTNPPGRKRSTSAPPIIRTDVNINIFEPNWC